MRKFPIFFLIFFLLAILFFLTWYLQEVIEIEEHEQFNNTNLAIQNVTAEQNITNETQEIFSIEYECLNDSHCNETAICINHSCKELNCPYPLYALNHKCVGIKCINDTDCQSNQICYFPQKECIKLECGLNEYAENHVCKKYECSKDIDCGLGAECFYHKCLRQVNYMYFETGDIGNTRTNGRGILNYNLLRNWDIGLFIAQNQTELDNLNSTVINLNNAPIDFSKNVALLAALHGLNPADIKFNTIMQVGSTIYIKMIVDDNETGVGDDAWHLITLKRENFTEKSNLEFRITPTGKMIIGGEQMLLGININYPTDAKGNQYMCANDTLIYEGESKTISLLGKDYSIKVYSVEQVSLKNYVSFSVDEGQINRIEEDNSTKIDNVRIYADYIYYTGKEMRMYATFSICYEG